MIIIFSVFNGLETVAKQGYVAFYPDIKISIAKGKFFPFDQEKIRHIEMTRNVQSISTVIEDFAFAVHFNEQKPVLLKGIDNNYMRVNDVSPYIIQGDTFVMTSQPQAETNPGNPNTAILGARILNELGTDINSLSYFTLNAPDASVTNPGADPLSALRSVKVQPAGVFHIQDDFDSKYILAPFGVVQDLFNQPGKCTSIEIKVAPGKDKEVQQDLEKLFGNGYKVETRYEQNKTMFMAMGAEKWVMYAILMMVMLIASFNMIGALSMLVLEKQKDIAILKAMGTLPGAIKKVFLLEGILWALMGGITGLLLGITVCLLQLKFELIKMGESFVISAFPVEIHGTDILLVFATVTVVGVLIAWYPAMRATKVVDPTLKSA